MKLIELTESDQPSYNQFVAAHGGSFLQSWEWGEWQIHLGRTVYRFKIIDENDEIASVIELIKTPVFGRKHYLYAPYGPVGVVRLKLEDLSFLKQELQKQFSDALFVRIEPQSKIAGLESVATKSTNIQPAITMIVDVNKSDEELLAAMHPKTRYNIKVAQQHGVNIVKDNNQQAIELILQTQIRQHFRGHGKQYYTNLLNFFTQHQGDLKVYVYQALYQGMPVTAAVMFDFGKTRVYLYGGSSEENKNVMAPYLLHWQAMQDARVAGLKYYDLGGSEVSGGGERGFTRFKRGFGGRVVEYAGAYDLVFNKTWYNVYRIGRVINRLMK